MVKYSPYLILLLFVIGCGQVKKIKNTPNLPRVAITGLAIESSTFSPALTEAAAFNIKEGENVFSFYPFLSPDSLFRQRAEWIPILNGHALPGGAVTREAYDSLINKTLKGLKENGPYDGLFFDIHGAMSVVGLEDAEGDFISKVRAVVGTKTIISTSMDLHGNVSPTLAHHSDLITCFRMAPHEDAIESKKRAVNNLLKRLENNKGKPKYKAWVPVPILLPGEKTSTRIEPGKSLYAEVAKKANLDGVIDAAIWIGYAWADEKRNHAVVMVTGDDEKAVTTSAEQLAQQFWDVREQFEFVAPVATLDESIAMAINSEASPFIISDMGDNPTAGGAGDVTWTLEKILSDERLNTSNSPTLIYASIPGPEFVKKALEIGEGGEISAFAGADIDDRFAPPVLISGTIETIKHGDYRAETEIVVSVGNTKVIVTKKRKPYHKETDFTNLNLEPKNTDILVVKIGYLVPELYDMRKGWVMALTPGGVDQDIERLNHQHIIRPMYPLDKDMATPNLEAQLIPLSHD
ncbi:MAG: M81 family metallopeptidase [Reichenbachiella sp.]